MNITFSNISDISNSKLLTSLNEQLLTNTFS